MASIPTDLAKAYLKELIDGAIARSRYICCFSCIAKEFEEERARLEIERTTVKQHVDVATRRGEDVQANAIFWEKEADELIQEDTKTKQKCLFGFCPHIIWQYKRGKELTNKKEQIKRLIETGKQLSIGLPARLPGIERYSSRYYIPFKSRESQHTELLEALTDDSNYITGLQGMGGTGKTTLAKEVGKVLKESNQFSHVIFTNVSFSPNIKKIQDDISGSLGLEWGEECNESDRPKKLWSRLTNGEKILLILDDVWGDIDFDLIGIPYSDNHKGCRVLVATRNLWVCNKMGCGKAIQVELLSEDDAWIMFKMHASLSDNLSKSLTEKAYKIAKECKRLPIAISVIASSLRGKLHREELDVALKSLQKPLSIHGVEDDLVKIYKCLNFSYDYMNDEKAKGLFLLCSVFREDEEISTERLTRLGIGVGLLGEDYGSYEDARSQVVVAKNKLLDSCLLLGTSERGVRMHDLVREVARWIANKEIQVVNFSNKNLKSLVEREKNIKYLLCESKLTDVFSCRLDTSKLEILIVDIDTGDSVDIPSSFFKNIAGLRVLELSFQNQPTLSLLQSIHLLKNIRSLLISRVDLGDISILGNLQTLETLDLVWCKIDELPHEITKLEKLKLLNLNFCEVRRNNPFEVIKSCSSLEELYFLHSFNDFCREINLPALKRYHICRMLAIINDSLSKCVAFDGGGDEHFFSEATFKYLIQTAEVLQLSQFEGQWRNLMPDIVHIDQGMNDLVEFRLRYDSQLQCLIDTKHIIDSQLPTVFSKLVVLHLCEINNMEVLCNGTLSFESLKSLEELSIECCENLQSLFNCKINLCNLKTMTLSACPMLVSLFQLSTSKSLVLLEELKIIDCEQLKNIITCDQRVEDSGEEIVEEDNDNMNHNSMFPKLKVLDIQRCPLLEFIFPFFSAQYLLVQGTINISFCDNLKYIFGQYQDVIIGSLKDLQLNDSPNFIGIFPKCHRAKSLTLSMKRSSPKDGSKAQMELDPIKCNCFSWTFICCYNHKLKNTNTEITLVSDDQQQDCSIALGLKEIMDHRISDGSTSGNTITTVLSNNSQTRIESHISSVSPIEKDKLSVEEATTSTNAELKTSSHRLKEIVEQNIQEGSTSTSQKTAAATLPTISETTKNEQPIQVVDLKQKGIVISVEEGTTSTNSKTITSSTHSEFGNQVSVQEGTTSTNAKTITSFTHLQLCWKETDDQSIQEGSTSQNTCAATLPTISETMNEPPLQLVASKRKGEEGTKSAKTITSSTNLESASSSSGPLATSKSIISSLEYDDGQIVIPYFPITTTESLTTQDNDEVSLNDAVVMKVSSMIEEQFSKDNDCEVPECKPSPSNNIPLPLTYQSPSMPSEGNPSQIVEDSSSHSLVTWELEKLVSKKYLDYENLPLLTDFLVKHPSVLLRDPSLNNRYKGYAYSCLSELLKFLQTHSMLDVLGSSRSDFVELLQGVHKFGFDKDWLDSVEKRALFLDLQFSQDTLQEILDSKKHVTKEVEDILLKINNFTQYVDDLKHQLTSSKAALESIIQQEAQVLKTKAALSAPLGY